MIFAGLLFLNVSSFLKCTMWTNSVPFIDPSSYLCRAFNFDARSDIITTNDVFL